MFVGLLAFFVLVFFIFQSIADRNYKAAIETIAKRTAALEGKVFKPTIQS